jgi:hypothetical protein
VRRLTLSGSRDEIRARTVEEAIGWIAEILEKGQSMAR